MNENLIFVVNLVRIFHKMIKCYVVDDELHALERICEYVEQTPDLKLIGKATDPATAFSDISQGIVPDVLFSDIDMPKMNGLELAELVGKDCTIVFTTGHADYALDAFEHEAFAYLLKPVSYPKFLKVAQRLIEHRKKNNLQHDEFLFIRGDMKGKIHRIELNDIIYLESAQNYVVITLETESVTTYMMISEMERFLPEDQFSRVHRSFIINHHRINYITPNQVIMKDGTHIPLSTSYKSAFLDKIQHRTIISERLSS